MVLRVRELGLVLALLATTGSVFAMRPRARVVEDAVAVVGDEGSAVDPREAFYQENMMSDSDLGGMKSVLLGVMRLDDVKKYLQRKSIRAPREVGEAVMGGQLSKVRAMEKAFSLKQGVLPMLVSGCFASMHDIDKHIQGGVGIPGLKTSMAPSWHYRIDFEDAKLIVWAVLVRYLQQGRDTGYQLSTAKTYHDLFCRLAPRFDLTHVRVRKPSFLDMREEGSQDLFNDDTCPVVTRYLEDDETNPRPFCAPFFASSHEQIAVRKQIRKDLAGILYRASCGDRDRLKFLRDLSIWIRRGGIWSVRGANIMLVDVGRSVYAVFLLVEAAALGGGALPNGPWGGFDEKKREANANCGGNEFGEMIFGKNEEMPRDPGARAKYIACRDSFQGLFKEFGKLDDPSIDILHKDLQALNQAHGFGDVLLEIIQACS